MSDPTKEEILAELTFFLGHRTFAKAPSQSAVLRYLVESRVNGADFGYFKESAIGVACLGKKVGYDTHQEPIVRVTIERLRDKLAEYYETEEGKMRRLRIGIETGFYTPEFSYAGEAQLSETLSPTPATSGLSAELIRRQEKTEAMLEELLGKFRTVDSKSMKAARPPKAERKENRVKRSIARVTTEGRVTPTGEVSAVTEVEAKGPNPTEESYRTGTPVVAADKPSWGAGGGPGIVFWLPDTWGGLLYLYTHPSTPQLQCLHGGGLSGWQEVLYDPWENWNDDRQPPVSPLAPSMDIASALSWLDCEPLYSLYLKHLRFDPPLMFPPPQPYLTQRRMGVATSIWDHRRFIESWTTANPGGMGNSNPKEKEWYMRFFAWLRRQYFWLWGTPDLPYPSSRRDEAMAKFLIKSTLSSLGFKNPEIDSTYYEYYDENADWGWGEGTVRG